MSDLQVFCDLLKTSNDKEIKVIHPLLLNNDDWKNVDKLLSALEPFDKYTKRVQGERCTLSDLYGFWLSLEIRLDKCDYDLAKHLRVEMNNRKQTLFDNPIMTAAIFLDPRYQRGLSANEKVNAKCYLKSLYKKIEELKTADSDENTIESDDENKSTDADDVDAHLDFICGEESNHNNIDRNSTQNTIDAQIENFVGTRSKTHVLEFWEKHQTEMPELFKLASTINSISPTQTNVERAFSALAVILSSRRTRLGDETLQSILMVRLNFSLYDELLKLSPNDQETEN